MTELTQELMTPDEAARWFRRSTSWLRQQGELLRLGRPGSQSLYHVRVCRAYVLGRLAGLEGEPLRAMQLRALSTACGVDEEEHAEMCAEVLPRADTGVEAAG